MRIVALTWAGHEALMRDPKRIGNFLRGVECNEHGIGLRHGCHDEVELVVRLDWIETMTEVSDG